MRIRSFAIASLMLLLSAVAAQDAAKVESFSPQGQVKDVRQIVARFSQPMVSFGDPRSEAPFMAGTESSAKVTTISMPTAEATPRVLSPADGTVIAPDPDTPQLASQRWCGPMPRKQCASA